MPKPKKRRRRKLIIGLIILVLAGGGWTYRSLHSAPDAIAIQTGKVTRRSLTETVMANGRIQPVTQVLISPEVAGEIVELPVVEGQKVKKGDLLVQIRPDTYRASANSAEANYQFALGGRSQAEAELIKAEADFHQNEELSKSRLISAQVFMEFKTAYELARLRMTNSIHQVNQARFALDKANEDLAKTKITAPIDGTITRLKSQLGERVLGTSFNMGTEMMTIAKLDEMEARVDIGEVDVVLIEIGQNVSLEVDAFKERKFKGTVSAIANASKGTSMSATQSIQTQSQDAPKFEVRIRVLDEEAFRPGMSVTAEIETRNRADVLTVPIESVTTRLPGPATAPAKPAEAGAGNAEKKDKPRNGKAEAIKPIEVVFGLDGDHVKMVPVKTGISDSDYFEIISGVNEGDTVVTGGYKAISKDLEDGKKVKVEAAAAPKKESK